MSFEANIDRFINIDLSIKLILGLVSRSIDNVYNQVLTTMTAKIIQHNIESLLAAFAIRGLRIVPNKYYQQGLTVGNEMYSIRHLPPAIFDTSITVHHQSELTIKSPITKRSITIDNCTGLYDSWVITGLTRYPFDSTFFNTHDQKYLDGIAHWLHKVVVPVTYVQLFHPVFAQLFIKTFCTDHMQQIFMIITVTDVVELPTDIRLLLLKVYVGTTDWYLFR